MRWPLLLVALAPCALPAIFGNQKPIVFQNEIARSGINFRLDNSATPDKQQVETMIGGLALFDYNNDGLPDIYFVNGAKLPEMDKTDPRYWNRLYRNNGDGTFTDVTVRAGLKGAGYGMGVAAGDYDNDGWTDLYIAGVNVNQLFHNNGDGTFTDVTRQAGVAGLHPTLGKLFSMSAGWFDYDNDGLLDLFVVNYVDRRPGNEPKCQSGGVRAYCSPDQYEGEPNQLFHNNGDGTFTDASLKSGIEKYVGKGMGVAFADYDGDGFIDVAVSNDTYRNFLFRNNRDGTFTEVGVVAGIAYNESGKSIAGMGIDFRDIDNDGKPDIWVVGLVQDTFPLFLNTGKGFDDVTESSGVARFSRRLTAWGAGIYDFDNDGWKDLFATGGSVLDNQESIDRMPSQLPNLLLWNRGGKCFEDLGPASSSFGQPKAHRGIAFGDLNNDGKIDAVVTCLNDRPEIWVNRSETRNHWIDLKLKGTKSNRQGLGTRIKVLPDRGPAQFNNATTSVGYASSSDDRVHFGLGTSPMVSRIELAWPSGKRQVLANIKADQVLHVTEPE